VRLHLRSDVPLGISLSGGIDSSAIVCAARHIQGPSAEIHSFSFIADDPRISEARWVDRAAQASGATVHRVHLQSRDLLESLNEVIAAQDEPFVSTSIFAQWCIFRAARDAGVKVLLDGQGADELLAGYHPYIAARIASLVRCGRLLEAARLFTRTRSARGASPAAVGRNLLRSMMRRNGWAGQPRDVLRRRLVESVRTSSLPMLLRYQDRNSMAFSVESRLPFLHADLARFTLSLPEEHLIDGAGVTKCVFRRAMRGIVPDEILNRRDKIAFNTPESRWLNELRPRLIGVLEREADERTIPLLHRERLRRRCDSLRRTNSETLWDQRTWRIVNLILWSRLNDVEYAVGAEQ
jgi:asparagine synthase (glutamine-hydrolysing)